MVVNVEESHLTVLLPQDEEDLPQEKRYTFNYASFLHWSVLRSTYCVTELYDLGEEKPPAHSGHLKEANEQGSLLHVTGLITFFYLFKAVR